MLMCCLKPTILMKMFKRTCGMVGLLESGSIPIEQLKTKRTISRTAEYPIGGSVGLGL